MEVIAIFLSVPVALVVNAVFCWFLVKFVSKSASASRRLRIAGHMVLAMLAVEVILLSTLGAVRSNGLIGSGFYVAHLCLFFLCPPALASSLVLKPSGGFFAKWYVAAVVCTVFAFFLVLLQYSVSESLYGID
jgi:quinol-cytochrome oxidoreductase complex cytochrome b subunit